MASTQRFLTFQVAGQAYGLPTTRVREVIPHMPISPVPDVPEFMLGMITLRNEVIPVIDLQLLFGQEEPTEIDSQTCFVIASFQSRTGTLTPVSLVARRILAAYHLEDKDIDPPLEIGGHLQVEYLIGLGKTPDGVKILLDVDRLLAKHGQVIEDAIATKLNEVAESAVGAGEGIDRADRVSTKTPHDTEAVSEKFKLLSIFLGEAEYGLPLSEIRKIIPAENIEPDHLAPSFVSGAMRHAGERFGVVDIRQRLGLHCDQVQGETQTVIVVDSGQCSIGYLIDGVGALYDVEKSSVLTSDSFDHLVPSHERGEGFVELEHRTLEVLSFERFLVEKDLETIRNWKGTTDQLFNITANVAGGPKEVPSEVPPELRKHAGSYLLVRIQGYLVGVPTKEIHEVLNSDDLMDLPLARNDFEGMLHLRGTAFPVMNLGQRLGLPERPDPEARSGIVLVRDGQERSGMLVDDIVGLQKIPDHAIRSKDESPMEVHQHLLAAVAKTECGIVSLIDVPTLLKDDGPSFLDKLRHFKDEMNELGVDINAALKTVGCLKSVSEPRAEIAALPETRPST